jgi:O-methyltransferase
MQRPRRIALFGAGQYGRALYRLLDRDLYDIVAFLDNKASETMDSEIPVHPVSAIPSLELDGIMLALKGDDRRAAVIEQLQDSGIEILLPPLDHIDIRSAELDLLALQLQDTAGAVAELGVYKGDFAEKLRSRFPDKLLYLFDTFEGFLPEDLAFEDESLVQSGHNAFKDTAFELVRSRFAAYEQVRIVKGRFPQSATASEAERFCFVSIDADLYLPVYEGLRFFYPRLSRGGCILIHDAESAQYPGAGKALSRFCHEEGLFPLPLCDLHGSAVLRKQGMISGS